MSRTARTPGSASCGRPGRSPAGSGATRRPSCRAPSRPPTSARTPPAPPPPRAASGRAASSRTTTAPVPASPCSSADRRRPDAACAPPGERARALARGGGGGGTRRRWSWGAGPEVPADPLPDRRAPPGRRSRARSPSPRRSRARRGSSDLKAISGIPSRSSVVAWPRPHHAPSRAAPRGLAAFGGDQRGDRHEVVGVGGVAQPEHERDPQRDRQRRAVEQAR